MSASRASRRTGCDRRSVGRELRLGEAERHRDRDEPLLRAVVQVALDPPPLRLGRLDEARARSLQLGEPRAQLRLQARVLERQRGRGADRLHELLVLAQRGIMDQRRDRLALALDDGRCPLAARLRQLDRRAVRVDIAGRAPEPSTRARARDRRARGASASRKSTAAAPSPSSTTRPATAPRASRRCTSAASTAIGIDANTSSRVHAGPGPSG